MKSSDPHAFAILAPAHLPADQWKCPGPRRTAGGATSRGTVYHGAMKRTCHPARWMCHGA